ncbi:MAG: MerR family transcriptional regulator [Candidatus Macondimonas sp.]
MYSSKIGAGEPDPLIQESAPTRDQELFPIRTVSSLTGVNSVTLRAWERRYGLIRPQRTPKGHRLYSRADIQRIEQVLGLLDRGISIGQARAALESQQRADEAPTPAVPRRDRGPWGGYIERMIEAIGAFDEKTLNTVYNEALSLYPVELVTSQLIVPLLEELGRRWQSREGSVAEEHFFSVFLRNKLGARFHHMALDTHGPKLLCACMPTENHELALLLFCLAALTRNYRIVLLGANMPFADLPLAARRSDSDAIVLAGSVGAYWPALEDELGALVRRVRVPVLVGGHLATLHRDAITRAGAIPLGSDIPQALRRIGEILSPPD